MKNQERLIKKIKQLKFWFWLNLWIIIISIAIIGIAAPYQTTISNIISTIFAYLLIGTIISTIIIHKKNKQNKKDFIIINRISKAIEDNKD